MTKRVPMTPIFETLDKRFAEECDAALAKYRAGADEVKIDLGGLTFKLFDRKDNDDRETVRMSMEEFLNAMLGKSARPTASWCAWTIMAQ